MRGALREALPGPLMLRIVLTTGALAGVGGRIELGMYASGAGLSANVGIR